METDCIPSAWAESAVTMKATRLQSAANTQLEVKRGIKLEVQLGQRLAKVGFVLVYNSASDVILGTA